MPTDQELKAKRAQLAADLLDDAQKLRRQLWNPAVERKALVVSDGRNAGSHVEIVEVKSRKPSFEAQRTIVAAVAIAVEQVLELDAGGITEEAQDDVARQRRARDARRIAAATAGSLPPAAGGQ